MVMRVEWRSALTMSGALPQACMATCMMGFFTKFMDATGVPLEPAMYAQAARVLGADWDTGKAGQMVDDISTTHDDDVEPVRDGWWTKLRFAVLGLMPDGMGSQDAALLEGAPISADEASAMLLARVGYGFPFLRYIRSLRFVQAMTQMILFNFDPNNTAIGLGRKARAGAVAVAALQNAELQYALRLLCAHNGVIDMFVAPNDVAGHLAHRLALVVSKVPVTIPADLLADLRAQPRVLSSAAIVELCSWVAVLQMLHRVQCFASAIANAP